MVDPQVQAIVRGLNKLAERVVIKIAFDVVANLVETTPVATGWARANWVPAIGSPLVTDLSGIPATTQGALSAKGQQDAATAGLLGYKLGKGSVFISNNVPYIIPLNMGSSKKAPSGFVQRAIRKAVTQDIRGLS